MRRSLKNEKDPKAPLHFNIAPKTATAIVPPKKVIKALYDYQPQNLNGQELAFHKGDFFHVLSRENDTDWYEACNPLVENARGLVPVSFFEVISKQERMSDNSVTSDGAQPESHDSGYSEKGTSGASHARSTSVAVSSKAGIHARGPSSGSRAGSMVYGIVQYDFKAERPDELQAEAGEAIIVIAQSNPEWFVAKPIGRLGGPGLIPVSFVEIKDMHTGRTVDDPLEAVRRAGVPRVEEWKRMAAEYKNNSISLGKLDGGQQGLISDFGRMSLNNGAARTPGHQAPNYYVRRPRAEEMLANQKPQNQHGHRRSQTQHNALLAPISASVPRYCFENDTYWYIIECQMEDGRYWELSRYYNDFYDFQIKLLEGFPEEAGNRGKPRTLPFMPGPVAHVNDSISNGRRQSLDDYVRKILSMPPHISKCNLLRQFFSPRQGDFEIDPNAIGEDYRLSGASQQSLNQIQSHLASQQSLNSLSASESFHEGMSPPAAWPVNPTDHHSMSAVIADPQSSGSRPPIGNQENIRSFTSASGSDLSIKIAFPGILIKQRWRPKSGEFTLQMFEEKVRYRINNNRANQVPPLPPITGPLLIEYDDHESGNMVPMTTDDHLGAAFSGVSKLMIRVTEV